MFDEFNPSADRSQSPTASSPTRPNSLPPNCDPDRFLDWRFKYAMHLADHADGLPITHDDPWIQAMIDFRHISLFHKGMPTETDLAINAAARLFVSDALAKHLLEARLLAQETPEEISTRCVLSPLTITAYSKLYFDVCGIERKGIWLMRPFTSVVATRPKMPQFGWRLKQMACFSSCEELEHNIDTLQRVEGRTLAVGCSVDGSPSEVREIVPRLAVATRLLPMSRSAMRELNQFQESAANDVRTGRTSQGTIESAINVLRRAKVPVSLQRELRSMRQALAATRQTA